MSNISEVVASEIEQAVQEIDERQTCDEVFNLVEEHRHVQGLDAEYEKVRADYNKTVEIHTGVDSKISSLKAEMDTLEAAMNALAGGLITQEMFTEHYKVVRDLHEIQGKEAHAILLRASAGVVFLDKIKEVKN